MSPQGKLIDGVAVARDTATRNAILEAMRATGAVRADAARKLGRSLAWLYVELRRLGMADEVRQIERAAGRRTWAPGRRAA